MSRDNKIDSTDNKIRAGLNNISLSFVFEARAWQFCEIQFVRGKGIVGLL